MEKEERIRVVVRARPYVRVAESSNNTRTPRNARRDKSADDQECVTANPENPHEVLIYTDTDRTHAASFRCEAFFPPTCSQQDVFDQIGAKEMVEAALEGFPVTIFAYGQTGAGKSFTIFGKEDRVTERRMALNDHDGLLPRTAQEIMNTISSRKGEVEYTLRVTCVEIYNEQVRDVFDPRKETLAVRSSKTHGFFLENATVVECVTAREIVRVVKAAATHRAKSSHLLNESSNRSHCLVTIYIDAAPVKPGSPNSNLSGKRYGKITIVDLAGSERVSDSGAVGTQLRETCHINRSLHCLSQVIQAMNASKSIKTGKAKFVPYRDSKLTMLLLDSLGGNCKTLMIACVNSSPKFAVESVRTLEFAMGVAKIKNRPTALLTPHEKLIKDLREQIRLLKLENMMLRARTPGYFMDHLNHSMDHSALLDASANEFDDQQMKQLRASDGYMNPLNMSHQYHTGGQQKLIQQELRTLKQKPQLRHQPQVLKRRNLKRLPASSNNKQHTLPPVSRRTPSQRSLQYIVPHPTNQDTNHHPLPRTNSLPPAYNDLFGIETVPCTQNQTSNSSSSQPPAPPINRQEATLPAINLSPEEQLQQLLQQMLPQSRTEQFAPVNPTARNKAQRIPSKPAKPPANATSTHNNQLPTNTENNSNKSSTEWDDQRAQDLFLQLCRL